MPRLVVENVPPEIFQRLQQRAAARHRSLPEEMLDMLHQLFQREVEPPSRLPDVLASEEISAPCDLPRSSQPEAVTAQNGQSRWPDPLPE